jgi:hypothetical protein
MAPPSRRRTCRNPSRPVSTAAIPAIAGVNNSVRVHARVQRLTSPNRGDGWAGALDQLAALSSISVQRMADSTHIGLLEDVRPAAESVHTITEVISSVRTTSRPFPPLTRTPPSRRARVPTRRPSRGSTHRRLPTHRGETTRAGN